MSIVEVQSPHHISFFENSKSFEFRRDEVMSYIQNLAPRYLLRNCERESWLLLIAPALENLALLSEVS